MFKHLDKITMSQFVELTRIVRTAVILDHMFEFIEQVVPQGHPLWDLWQKFQEQNDADFIRWTQYVEVGAAVEQVNGRDLDMPDGNERT